MDGKSLRGRRLACRHTDLPVVACAITRCPHAVAALGAQLGEMSANGCGEDRILRHARNMYAALMIRNGESEKAIALLQEAKGDEASQLLLAFAHHAEGNFREACKAARSSVLSGVSNVEEHELCLLFGNCTTKAMYGK